jgi:hypothetical protein
MNRVSSIALSSFLALLLFGCASTPRSQTENERTIVGLYTGSYTATQSSDGIIQNWTLYSDKTLVGSWITQKKSYSINLKGRYDIIDKTIVFEGSGKVSVFGLDFYATHISGRGMMNDQSIEGSFILFVDKDGFWGDYGNFSANRKL